VNVSDKILAREEVPTWRSKIRSSGKTLVVTNGCFDVLHRGHVTYLIEAKRLGHALLVGLNSDASVRELKGFERPVNPETDRAFVLAALACVDAVCIFSDRTAVRFLAEAKPDVYVKGGDYTLETLNCEERKTVESFGGRITLLPLVPGQSTTSMLQRIARL